MSQYLVKAAELIAKAADDNEKTYGSGASFPASTRYQENALRCADAYAVLAAIEHDQVPAGLVQRVLDAIPAGINHSC
jgi:hypothetical protein